MDNMRCRAIRMVIFALLAFVSAQSAVAMQRESCKEVAWSMSRCLRGCTRPFWRLVSAAMGLRAYRN